MKHIIFFTFIVFTCTCCNKPKTEQASLEALPGSANDTNEIKSLNNKAITFLGSNPDSALKYTVRVLALSKKIGWRKGMWIGYHQTGNCYRLKSKFSDAYLYFKKAVEICDLKSGEIKIDNPPAHTATRKAMSLSNVGLILTELGNYPKALENLLQALKLNEKYGASTTANLINIANVYNYNSEYDKADKYYKTALNDADTTNKLIIQGNLASILYKKKNFKEALVLFNESLKLAQQKGDKNYISDRLTNIGLIYGEEKQFDKAFENLFTSLSLAKETGNEAIEVPALANIGDVYIKKEQYADAEKYLILGLEKSKKIETAEYTMEIEKLLVELYKKAGKFEKALSHQANAFAVNDSLFTSRRKENNDITGQVIKYDFEKEAAIEKDKHLNELKQQELKQRSIIIISSIILVAVVVLVLVYKRKRDAEQKSKETAAQLRITDTELKVLRLQINPHFIDNAMQRIQEFMRNNKATEADAYLGKFSRLMRVFLENSKRDEIALSEELNSLKIYMDFENLNMKFPFSYKFQIGENINPDSTSIPPNILQPFVENSIKHGFTLKDAPGNITIYIHKKEDDLHIIIEDDGVGRDESKRVAMPMLKESHGIKITQERINIINNKNNLNASFKIIDLFKDNKAVGTRIELNLPFFQA